ncbi:transcription elongation factor GreA [Spiroplasma endosymbiont of Anurida maritima]|uniref:transcription elongation factor GreA n=1 Tax=Spiroplasma endosymbiont of Anurida maritima TaxID=2967972 RepID=UPI0036D2B67D
MNEKILLTKEGIVELQKELNNLLNVIRPKVIEELKEAREQGDLSENADYDAARNRQAEVESRIKEIENTLTHAKEITEAAAIGSISLGSIVTYKNLTTNKETIVKITGAVEADPFKGSISNETPVAVAMMNGMVGDEIEVKTPVDNYRIKIIDVR